MKLSKRKDDYKIREVKEKVKIAEVRIVEDQ